MKHHEFEWSTKSFEHSDEGLYETDRLAMKAMGVVNKHFLAPMSKTDLKSWRNYDGYRHHIEELQQNKGDEVWIRPWIIGHWFDDRECVLRLNPTEFIEEAVKESEFAGKVKWGHREGRLFGFYFMVTRKEENWSALFAFRVDHLNGAKYLHDLPVTKALCMSIDGDSNVLENWLDAAYRGSGAIVF